MWGKAGQIVKHPDRYGARPSNAASDGVADKCAAKRVLGCKINPLELFQETLGFRGAAL